MDLMIVGHSSFYLRSGWIKKGIEYIGRDSNESAFSKSNIKAIDELGIGSVMVQSLRFWLNFLDVIKKENKKFVPKRGIERILEIDPYLEKNSVLWLLHSYMMERENSEEIPVIWNCLIGNKNLNVFNEESAEHIINIFLKENNGVVSERSMRDSLSVFIKTYYRDRNLISDPEDNIVSPFVKLGYLKKNSENQYYFRSIEHNEISEYVALYLLMKALNKTNQKEININEAYDHFNKIIKMKFSSYEKIITKLENREILSQDRAAGLQNIHIKKELMENEIIERILESEN